MNYTVPGVSIAVSSKGKTISCIENALLLLVVEQLIITLSKASVLEEMENW